MNRAHRNRLDGLTCGEVQAMLVAGNATVTAVSNRTGKQYTFKVQAPIDAPGHPSRGVYVLKGPVNTADYLKIGSIHVASMTFRAGMAFTEHGAAVAFGWLLHQVVKGAEDEDQTVANAWKNRAQLWHEGSCLRCGRPLTRAESIARGVGPVCADRMGLPPAEPVVDVDNHVEGSTDGP